MDDTLISIIAILFLFGTPAILGMIGAVLWRLNIVSKYRERERAREMYENLIAEKLDVLKTAIAMGMSRSELDYLDRRLEDLIGTDKMRALLDEKQPTIPAVAQVPAADLDHELEGLKQAGGKRGSERR